MSTSPRITRMIGNRMLLSIDVVRASDNIGKQLLSDHQFIADWKRMVVGTFVVSRSRSWLINTQVSNTASQGISVRSSHSKSNQILYLILNQRSLG